MIRLTDAERELLGDASETIGKPTSTWARDELIRLARSIVAAKKKPTPRKK